MKFPWAVTIKLVIFALCSVFVLTIMWNTLRNATDGDQITYHAEFGDASGLRKGDSIRVAGVRIGKVSEIELGDHNQAVVEFTVSEHNRLRANTAVLIRYENLIGQRYLALRPGRGDDDSLLPEGATVPMSRTEPALDLTVLMNGFDPLFKVLSPDDLNKVATTIVQVFQGEGASLNDLLQQVGAISGDLAERDQLIGRLITNLARAVTHLAEQDDQFSSLVDETRDLVTELAGDREAIGQSIKSMSKLSDAVTSLLSDIRPALRRDLVKAERVLGIYARDREAVGAVLGATEDFFSRAGRPLQYGSWANIYGCTIQVAGVDGGLSELLAGTTQSEVCQ